METDGPEIEQLHLADPEALDSVAAMIEDTTRHDRHRPIGEHALVELNEGPRLFPHAAFVTRVGDEVAGYAHLSKRDTVSGWRRSDLDWHLQEPWFDPDTFVLAEDGEGIAGYCWMKADGDEAGVYFLGVHPRARATGLAGALCARGSRSPSRAVRRRSSSAWTKRTRRRSVCIGGSGSRPSTSTSAMRWTSRRARVPPTRADVPAALPSRRAPRARS